MKFENLTIRTKKQVLLNDISLEFKDGETSHILGKNGVGKTCLAKAIIGAFPYDGDIILNGEDACVIGSYTNIPGDLKVKDVVDILERKMDLQLSKSLFSKLDINGKMIKKRIKHLSDGQKQKVKLLYFLSTNPKVVICDEFTTALDKKSCLEVYSFLNSYRAEKQAIVINITHNLTDLEYMDGNYYLIADEAICKFDSKEDVVDSYIRW